MLAFVPPGEGEPAAFREPWEAQAFAMVLKLHEAGCFTWAEWAETLGAEIKAAQAAGDPDLGDTYYRHWLSALERLVEGKRLATPSELAARRLEVAANIRQHVHTARREPVRIA